MLWLGRSIFSKILFFFSGIFLLLITLAHFKLGLVGVVFAAIFIALLFSMFFLKSAIGILGIIAIIGGILFTFF